MSLVLMVAIAVVLTAVIGTVVLGTAEEVDQTAPQVSFESEVRQVSFGSADYDIVFLTHSYGDAIAAENIHITVNGNQAWDVAGMDDGTGRTVKPAEGAGTLKSGSELRLVYWDNNYGNFPVSSGDLYVTKSGGCGQVITATDVSDCALNDDMVGDRDRIKVIYEFPSTGETVVLDEITV